MWSWSGKWSLFIFLAKFSVLGFQSSGDCVALNNRNPPEDACFWRRKQGYFDTQSHRGILYMTYLWSELMPKSASADTDLEHFLFLFGVCVQYSAKLLKKPDQCRAVYACSHLFWVDDQDEMKDGERFVIFSSSINAQRHFYNCISFHL